MAQAPLPGRKWPGLRTASQHYEPLAARNCLGFAVGQQGVYDSLRFLARKQILKRAIEFLFAIDRTHALGMNFKRVKIHQTVPDEKQPVTVIIKGRSDQIEVVLQLVLDSQS